MTSFMVSAETQIRDLLHLERLFCFADTGRISCRHCGATLRKNLDSQRDDSIVHVRFEIHDSERICCVPVTRDGCVYMDIPWCSACHHRRPNGNGCAHVHVPNGKLTKVNVFTDELEPTHQR